MSILKSYEFTDREGHPQHETMPPEAADEELSIEELRDKLLSWALQNGRERPYIDAVSEMSREQLEAELKKIKEHNS